jgi:antitoxin Phd
MKSWPIQDAKNQFSHVIDLACTKGPQTITKHGEPIVVMVPVDLYNKKIAPRETPLEFFSKLRGSGLKLERRKDLPRTIEL